ncbi:MAG: Hsp33 family molecular chaperone HslO [Agitococcus sp.]
MPDIRQRFYFANSPVRGEIVQVQQCLEYIFARHTYPIVIQRLLGEFVTACVLLTATLKLKGRLSLQARGKGALKMIMAECNHHHQIRAIAQLNENIECSNHATLAELLAEGLLVITLEPEHGQRYQGIVELTGKTLADYLENYFKQSEQLPTKLWLAANETQAAGLLLQALPQQHDEDADRWSRLMQVTQTVKAEELLHLTSDEILYRLYYEEEVALPEPHEISFSCTCSREGTANALISIGLTECEDILAEQGDIRLNCQFCHHEYAFNAADIKQLFAVKLH